MARMSAEKRIELGTQMVERWTAANQESDRSVRFVKDMLVRMGRGKGLTKRQREWYDSAVLTEPQKPKNEELVNRLLAASEMIGMEKVSQPLKDFAFKLSKGWNLSEKQTAFMNKLLTKLMKLPKTASGNLRQSKSNRLKQALHSADVIMITTLTAAQAFALLF